MDPQLVVLTETLGAGIEQHKASSAFYREKGEGFAAAQTENKQKTDAAITDLSVAVVNEMKQLASGFFQRFVSVEGNDDTADLTQGKPFRTVKAAIESTPAGMRVNVSLLNADGHPVFDLGSNTVDVLGRHIHISYLGQLMGDHGAGATLQFESYFNNTTEKAGVYGFNGFGLVTISGVTIKSDQIPDEDVNIGGGFFANNYNSLRVRLWSVTLCCVRVPILEGSSGDEFSVSIVNSTIKKDQEFGILATPTHNSSISIVTAGSIAIEGVKNDYFLSAYGAARFKWNRNYITGTL